jgi:hypothetical protein
MLRTWKTMLLLAPLTGAIALAGCPNPQGRYDEFVDRSAEERGRGAPDFMVPDRGEDPFDPASLAGTFLFALATDLDATRPLLFRADVAVEGEPGARTIEFTLTPLRSWCGMARCEENAPDRREELPPPVPSPGPAPLAEDGTFEIDFGDVQVAGGVNAISGSDIVAKLKIFGRPSATDTPCGQVEGKLTAPFEYNLARGANSFGTVRAEPADFKGVSTVGRCL